MKGAEDDLSHLEFFIFSFRLSLFIYLFTIASNEMKKKNLHFSPFFMFSVVYMFISVQEILGSRDRIQS
jgi:hypothetical protein